MKTPNNGGPAFPTTLPYAYVGMSLRDWFAGQALAGAMTTVKCEHESQLPNTLAMVAKFSYVAADAMLEARK